MLRSQVLDSTWTVSLDGVPFLEHGPETPFAVALRREKTYESDRGTVKEHVVEAERVPLANVSQEGDTVTLSGGGHALTVRVVPCPGGVDQDARFAKPTPHPHDDDRKPEVSR